MPAMLCGWCSGASGTSFRSLGDRRAVDQHRLDELGSPVDDAMADRDDAARVAHALEPPENDPRRRVMVGPAPGRQSELGLLAGRPLHRAFRIGPDALDLARGEVIEDGIVRAEGGELQRRRAGVEGDDDLVVQGSAPGLAWITRRPWRPAAFRRRPGLRGDSTRKAGRARRRRASRVHCRRGSSA